MGLAKAAGGQLADGAAAHPSKLQIPWDSMSNITVDLAFKSTACCITALVYLGITSPRDNGEMHVANSMRASCLNPGLSHQLPPDRVSPPSNPEIRAVIASDISISLRQDTS